jgi:hypothetical protein
MARMEIEAGTKITVRAGLHIGKIGTVTRVLHRQVVVAGDSFGVIRVNYSSVRVRKKGRPMHSLPFDRPVYNRKYYQKHIHVLRRRACERHYLGYFRRHVQGMIANDQVGVQFQDILRLFTDRFEHTHTRTPTLSSLSHHLPPQSIFSFFFTPTFSSSIVLP